MADILDGFAQVRLTFIRANLRPPSVLLLESHEEGVRFLSEIRQQRTWSAVVGSGALGQPIEMADGAVWMEVEIMGMKVRWPATRYAARDGSWSYA